MRPLIHKASVKLTSPDRTKNISLGDPLTLRLQKDGKISVIRASPPKLPFGIGMSRESILGHLGDQATELLKHAVAQEARLRVRIVEIEPAYLRISGDARVFISVWGDPTNVQTNGS
jgi:hypothetical protein